MGSDGKVESRSRTAQHPQEGKAWREQKLSRLLMEQMMLCVCMPRQEYFLIPQPDTGVQ